MAQHYGFVISPTKPYHARHKGKVENGVHPGLAAGQATSNATSLRVRISLTFWWPTSI
jgi:hypothetical protein